MHISCVCSAWSLKHDCTQAFSQRGVRMSLDTLLLNLDTLISISFVYNAMGWTGIGDPIHPKCIFLDTQFLNPGKRNSVVIYKQSWVFISAALTLVFEWQVQLGSQLLSAVCAIFLLVCTTSNFNSCDWSHHCQYICSHVRSSCEHFLMKKSRCMENPICVDTPHFTGNVIWSRTKNQ